MKKAEIVIYMALCAGLCILLHTQGINMIDSPAKFLSIQSLGTILFAFLAFAPDE